VEMPALLVLLDRLQQSQRDHRSRLAGNSQKARAEIDPFQGATPALARLAEECRRIRGSESPVLIQGETGTGKELIARAIHEASARRQRPCVVINCAALPAALVRERTSFRSSAKRTGLWVDAMARRRGSACSGQP